MDTLVIHTNDTATNISLGNNSSGSAFTGYNQKMLIGNAGTIINNNLTISGTLQSPMTSLLSVSSNIIDGKVGTIIGVSIPQFLTRNETTLPSSFINSSLTSLGTIIDFNATRGAFGRTHGGKTTLELRANQTEAGALTLLPKIDNAENSIYFNPSSTIAGYFSGVTGTWLIGTNINGGDSNSFSIWNSNLSTKNFKLDINGNALLTNNLTISGTLQCFQTSILGTSVSVIDSKLNTGIIGDFWGTTTTSKQINIADNLLINSGDSNSFIQFRNSGTSTNGLIGLVGDNLIARISDSASFKFQSTSGTDLVYINNNGNVGIGANNNVSKFDITGDCIIRNQDPLILYNGSGNVNLKMQNASYSKRFEQQSGGGFYMWDEGNNEIYHISTDRQMWWQGDFNVAGTYYDSGLPLTPSSKKIKENIRELPDNKILDKIEFKHYTKTYKNKTYDEVGIIIEDLEKIEGIDKI